MEQKPLIEYPSVYPFKVMGKHEHGFRDYVRRLFIRLLGRDVADDSLVERTSQQGKYLSVTIDVLLLSEEQRVHVYTELKKEKRILYYL